MVRSFRHWRHRTTRPRLSAGFTLIELMVTIAVLAVVMAIAIPNFRGLVNSNRLTAQANELVATLQYAKSEAVRLNGKVTVCPSTNATSCGGTDWSRLIVLLNRSNEVLRQANASGQAGLTADVASITFSPDGLARASNGLLAAANIKVCINTTQPAQNQRVVALAGGSRISVGQASGNCP